MIFLLLLVVKLFSQNTTLTQHLKQVEKLGSTNPLKTADQLVQIRDSLGVHHASYHELNHKIAHHYIKGGQYSNALYTNIQGQKVLTDDASHHHVHYLKDKGVTYYYLRKREKAQQLFYEAIKYQQKHNIDEFHLAETYNGLGAILTEKGQMDSARKYLNKAIRLNQQKAEKGLEYSSLPYRILATSYTLEGNFKEAKKRFKDAFYKSLEREDTIEIIGSNLFYGDLFLELNQPDSALHFYKNGQQYAAKLNNPDVKQEVSRHIKQAYAALKDYEQAYYITDSALVYQSKTYQKQMAEKTAEMEVQLETAKLKQEYLEKQNEVVTERAKSRQYILIAAIMLLLLGLALLASVYYYRKRSSDKKQLEQEAIIKMQEERLRISKELHDNIGTHVTVITNSIDQLLWKKREESETEKKVLENLGDYARQTMFDLRETVWAMKEEHINSSELCQRIQQFVKRVDELNPSINFQFNCNFNKNLNWVPQSSLNLLRIVQESVQNALKHGGELSTISISVNFTANDWCISIEDNGKGFSPEHTQSKGNGLINMQSRAKESGFSLTISSQLNKGTCVQISKAS